MYRQLNEKWGLTLLTGLLLVVAPASCGEGSFGAAGEPCGEDEVSGVIAPRCDSALCLELSCAVEAAEAITKKVCAGRVCSCTESGCRDDLCDDETQACVRTRDGAAYCLPIAVCK